MKIKGTLFPIGGNEDKGMGPNEMYTLDFIEDGILSKLVKTIGGPDHSIVVITTASSIPESVGKNYVDAFGKLGCHQIKVLDIRKRAAANERDILQLVDNSSCTLFCGGDQSKITQIIGQTDLHDLLKHKYQNEEYVIAGTSAGAMCMSREMIAGGSSTEALWKGAVKMSAGMDFVPELVIDSHFIQRGRFGRLAEAMAHFPDLLGIGLAEDTGILITEGNICTVVGSGMVIIFDPSALTHNKVHLLEEGTPMSMSNLIVHVLANGDKFLIDERKLEILPLDGKFEWEKKS